MEDIGKATASCVDFCGWLASVRKVPGLRTNPGSGRVGRGLDVIGTLGADGLN